MAATSALSVSDAFTTTLRSEFEENFTSRGELGASVSIWKNGQELITLVAGTAKPETGEPWTENTLAPVWSATKGPAALSCLLALDEAGLWLGDKVAKVWPAFAGGGKGDVSFRQLLSHTAGLSALDHSTPIHDFDAVCEALEQQIPFATPGTAQAYHARTFGFLLDKIVRCVSPSESLGSYFREKVGALMNLDFWIGLPESEHLRVASLQPAKIKVGAPQDDFTRAMQDSQSLTRRTFSSPSGLHGVRDMNRPEVLSAGYASMGGVGSASALAAFYSMLASGGVWQGRQLVPARILEALETPLSQQQDGVLCTPIAFAAGVMKDPVSADGTKLRSHYSASLRAYGHPGAGGSLAFADPARGLGFAYVMNQMGASALPNERSLMLVKLLDMLD